MAHKKNDSEKLVKTYKFKANISESEIRAKWIPTIEEYNKYYNSVSDWICRNLTTFKIGDLAQYISNIDSAYYKLVTDEVYSQQPLYKIFLIKQANSVDNALYSAIKSLNVENYSGNMIGLSETDYRRFGYIQSVISNYRTKIRTMKPRFKYKNLQENNSDEMLFAQTIYEMVEKDLDCENDWKNIISNYKNRQVENTRKIERFETLYEFYKVHSTEIDEKKMSVAIEHLEHFNGCRRKSVSAITIHSQKYTIEKEGLNSFVFTINKNFGSINLFGNRQVVLVDEKGNRCDLVDITENKGDYITFQIKNNALFVIITSSVDFEKECSEIKNVVGVDINIKHSIMASSIVDNGKVEGYLNIYKELLKENDFCDTCTDDELHIFKEMSKSVNFGLLECDSLFARVSSQLYNGNDDFLKLDDRLLKREKAIEKVLNGIADEYRKKDCHIASYIDYVKIIRNSYKSYFILKEKYYEKQKEYDIEMGYADENTDSKEYMDSRRFENPFVNTKTAQDILSKLVKIENRLIGCRNNIVNYAFNVFKNNGFDTISLEYIDSSQFEKRRILTPKSMLKYHDFEGKTYAEILDKKIPFNNDNYIFDFDEKGKVANIEFSLLGKREVVKTNFFNLIIKAIHFADIKDKFIQLSNNSQINVVLVPSAFSSQMDSIEHKLYVDESGKLVDKKKVRTQQEKHINGLNADYNAACNIAYIAKRTDFLEKVCVKGKDGKNSYSSPYWCVKKAFKKNVSANMIDTIRKMKMTKVFAA